MALSKNPFTQDDGNSHTCYYEILQPFESTECTIRASSFRSRLSRAQKPSPARSSHRGRRRQPSITTNRERELLTRETWKGMARVWTNNGVNRQTYKTHSSVPPRRSAAAFRAAPLRGLSYTLRYIPDTLGGAAERPPATSAYQRPCTCGSKY
ncbi:hypothetical protein K458DRAFT_398654 [Lentithecium fluviatile CBS 122367]|uniref:Uncharacterized protein n=1 Tax=Lentithecium fluviatile CBS 122367 TaxID=1168545 RepID=A0A6G1JJI9_9PLEO|nr:hypothetical protein K458DRAFT_398654 [Lentithecium fluviatile CBS 122367]